MEDLPLEVLGVAVDQWEVGKKRLVDQAGRS